jgi:hypothetical protein
VIFYFDNPRFPCCIRVRVEVWAVDSQLTGKRRLHTMGARNFVFRRTGKRPILRPRLTAGRKAPFPIRISVWH